MRWASGERGPPETEPYSPVHQDSKPEDERQEVDRIHQRDRCRRARRKVVDAEVEQFEKERRGDGQKNAFQLSAAIELPRQKAGKRD